MDVFDLVAKIALDASEYEAGLDSAKKSSTTFANVAKGIGAGSAAIGATVTAVGAAATAAGKAIYSTASDVAEQGDAIDKASQKLGVSAENYQKLAYAAELSGTSVDKFSKGVMNITNALADQANGVEDASEAFDAISVSMYNLDGSLKDSETLLMDSMYALADMTDETQRNAAANEIFGKSYQDLLPLLNSGSDGIKGMIKEAEDYGMIMSNEAVKASADFDDSITKLSGTFDGLKTQMVSDFLPSITSVMGGLADLFAGNEGAGDQIVDGVSDALDNLTELIPRVVDVVGDIASAVMENFPTIFENIIGAIVDYVPMLIEKIPDIIASVSDFLVKEIPVIIQAVVSIVMAIVDALPEIIVAIVDALPDIITSVVTGLIECLPQLIEGLCTLIIELVAHLPEIILVLIESIPEIIVSIVKAIIDCAPQFVEAGKTLVTKFGEAMKSMFETVKGWGKEKILSMAKVFLSIKDKFVEVGKNLISGLWDGIKNAWSTLLDGVSNLANGLVDKVKGVFGIHSPSTVFATIGDNIVAGLENGLENFPTGEDIVGRIGDVSANITGSISNVGTSDYGNIENNVIVTLEGDAAALFKVMRQENRKYIKSSGGRSAFA